MRDDVMLFSSAKVHNFEKLNPLFSKCDIKVMYAGENRNKSSMSKEAINKAIPSIFGIPIVGEFIEEKKDFGGHGGKVKIEGKEIKTIHTTKPIGHVPESAKVFWEDVEEDNGTVREYLCIEGALLWTGRYEEAKTIVSDSKGQSMEISINSGKFNSDKVYEIDDFNFSALCVLGDGVEPCFENAEITGYSLDREEFSKQFNSMMEELRFSIEDYNKSSNEDNQKGGSKMSKNNEFGLSANQLTSEFSKILRSQTEKDEYGYDRANFYYVDHNDEFVIAQSRKDSFRLVGMKYSIKGDVPELDYDSKQVFKIEYKPLESGADESTADFSMKSNEAVEYEVQVESHKLETKLKGEFTILKEEAVNAIKKDLDNKTSEFETLNADFEALKSDKEALEQFKLDKLKEERQLQEESIYTRFAGQLTEEEINSVKEKAFELSVEEIEGELFMLVGKKATETYSKSKPNTNNTNTNTKVPVDTNFNKKENSAPYSHILERHVSK